MISVIVVKVKYAKQKAQDLNSCAFIMDVFCERKGYTIISFRL